MSSSAPPNPVENAAPKLAIWHLFLWMACVAAIAAWRHSSYGEIAGSSWQFRAVRLVGDLNSCVLSGLVLAGLLLALACALTRRGRVPISGGHWLLVTNGVIMIIWEANNSIRWIVNPGLHPNELQYLVSCIAFFLMASVNLLTAFALRDAWPWRLVFVGYSVCSLVLAVILSQTLGASRNEAEDWLHIGLSLYRPAQWLLLAVIILLSAVDIVRRTPRDWLHWTGIGYITSWEISHILLQLLDGLVQP